MTINMDKLQDMLFQKSEEHLSFVGSALLQFEVEAPYLEIVNSIFRAVHSLKSGAAIFGMDVLIELARLIENLLDQTCNEELNIDTDTSIGNGDFSFWLMSAELNTVAVLITGTRKDCALCMKKLFNKISVRQAFASGE